MPLLEPKPTGGYFAKASIKGVAVTFHLTPFGQKRLLDAGIQPGKKFPLALLADLARQGHARTPPSVAEQSGLFYAEQFDRTSRVTKKPSACSPPARTMGSSTTCISSPGKPVAEARRNFCAVAVVRPCRSGSR